MAEFFEDVTVGDERSFGAYEVSADEIREFATQYDPQPFHVDEAAAADSMFGGLVASGWHTASMTMRLLVDNYLNDSGAMGSPGLERLRWRKPVRPGDVLSVDVEVLDKEAWDERRGAVTQCVTTHTDDGDVVMTMDALVLYPRR
ncbi:MaoC family dehydratase [Halobacteriales archaeon Cl-PHB]